jgi:quercetin dioxygenase-like cupin family protein
MISQIEREQANPTLAVTLRIAQAFGMPLAELVDAPGASATVQVIRHDDRAYHYRSDDLCRLRTLSPLNLEKDVELYELQLEPGGTLRSAPHFAGTREYLTVVKGSIRVESGDDSDSLHTGDSANYRADIPHAIINDCPHQALAILVVIYR